MKNGIEKKINKILNEEETFLLSLLLLSQLHDDERYRDLSELIFLFDNYKGFKRFIKYYEGKTIKVPTFLELRQVLKLLELFQKVVVDKKDFDIYYEKLKMANLGLSKEYCDNEIQRFTQYLKKERKRNFKTVKEVR